MSHFMGRKNARVLSGMKVGSVSHTDIRLVCVIIKAFKQHLPLLCLCSWNICRPWT